MKGIIGVGIDWKEKGTTGITRRVMGVGYRDGHVE